MPVIDAPAKASDFEQGIDVLENSILRNDTKLLNTLLLDRTTRRNILWATKDYESLGDGYEEFSEILPELITGEHDTVIQPRITKTQNYQTGRTRDKAEVFTPCWVCNKQNNLVDIQWFGREDVFNIETDDSWVAKTDKVIFNNPKKTWKKYVDAKRLEITCGEAPYLVSRYDTVTGRQIPIERRIGLLDRKMRVVNENAETDEEWLEWTVRAFQSVYGYEYQGDNLLLARENLFFSLVDYHKDRFKETPDIGLQRKIAHIISWNIWQMDGLKYVVPGSCHDEVETQSNFLGKVITNPCLGCAKNDIQWHNGVYCKIRDWRFKCPRYFKDMMKGRG